MLILSSSFFQSSFDKTVPNIRRRILKLMKRPQSQMTVKICSAECAHDEVSRKVLRAVGLYKGR